MPHARLGDEVSGIILIVLLMYFQGFVVGLSVAAFAIAVGACVNLWKYHCADTKP